MSRVVVLGAGVSGHTAAALLRKWLDRKDEVVVVSPQFDYNWIPSNIWVGVGLMPKHKVVTPLAPIYKQHKIVFKQARATKLFPEGGVGSSQPYVEIEWTLDEKRGQVERLPYDFLINATGPKLNFGSQFVQRYRRLHHRISHRA